MNRLLKRLLVLSLSAGLLSLVPSLCAADSTTRAKAKETTANAKPKRDWYPFGGIVSSVDRQANTVSLKKKAGERVLRLDSKSTLEIAGQPATLGGVKVGDYAHGKLHKDSAGNEVITNAKFDKEQPSKRKKAADTEPRTSSGSKATP